MGFFLLISILTLLKLLLLLRIVRVWCMMQEGAILNKFSSLINYLVYKMSEKSKNVRGDISKLLGFFSDQQSNTQICYSLLSHTLKLWLAFNWKWMLSIYQLSKKCLKCQVVFFSQKDSIESVPPPPRPPRTSDPAPFMSPPRIPPRIPERSVKGQWLSLLNNNSSIQLYITQYEVANISFLQCDYA